MFAVCRIRHSKSLYYYLKIMLPSQFFQQIHLPIAFRKDVRYPHSKAEGTIGYSPEGIAQTWQVLTYIP